MQSPLAAKSMLLAVTQAGPRIVAVGERGIVVYSDDEGTSWKQGQVPVSVTLTAVRFASKTLGWAVGHDGVILMTQDGGATWRKQFDGSNANTLVLKELEASVATLEATQEKASAKEHAALDTALEAARNSLEDAKAGAEFGPSRPLFGLWVDDATHVTVVGSFGQIFHTDDGGQNWVSWGSRIQNPEGFHYNDLARLADGTLLISGEAGKLRRSRDNGEHWETIDTGYAGHLYGTAAIPQSKALVTYGFAGNLLKSSDDGKTWKPLPRLTHKPLIGNLQLANGTLVLVDRDRHLLLSNDQGSSFTLGKSPTGRPVAALLPQLIKGRLLVAGVGGVTLVPLDTLDASEKTNN